MEQTARAQDRCPYSRDFGYGFDACPAFEATVASVSDSRGGELLPVITCRHLTVGQRAAGRFYPRCAVGGPAVLEQVAGEATGSD